MPTETIGYTNGIRDGMQAQNHERKLASNRDWKGALDKAKDRWVNEQTSDVENVEPCPGEQSHHRKNRVIIHWALDFPFWILITKQVLSSKVLQCGKALSWYDGSLNWWCTGVFLRSRGNERLIDFGSWAFDKTCISGKVLKNLHLQVSPSFSPSKRRTTNFSGTNTFITIQMNLNSSFLLLKIPHSELEIRSTFLANPSEPMAQASSSSRGILYLKTLGSLIHRYIHRFLRSLQIIIINVTMKVKYMVMLFMAFMVSQFH